MSWHPLLFFNKINIFFGKLPSQNRAIAYTFISIFFFTLMGIFIRKSSESIHIMEVIFLRNLLACFIIIPIMCSSGLISFKMNNPKLFIWRAIFGSIGMFAGFISITLIPLAQATAISFTQPIFITIGATLFLGEIINIITEDEAFEGNKLVVLYDESIVTGPVVSDFLMFAKDRKANTSSLKGYYADVSMVNDSRGEIELFAIGLGTTASSK